MTVKTRFAPSPTGYLHIGGARTALFNYLYARKHKGKFVLRIEDTDAERSTEASIQAILDGMEWLGLEYDEGPFYQSKRYDLYREYADKLLKKGDAYKCYCTAEELEERRKQALKEGRPPKYDGRCRERTDSPALPFALRFKVGPGKTVVDDAVKGKTAFEHSDIEDVIILRSDTTPTYNFCVVVDDATMGITHVIRGDDHLNNTPKQMLMYDALGFPLPVFAHLPMILGSDKTRLSKRHGATSVTAYRDMGYLPEALINYLARLGWSHGDEEIFTLQSLIEKFTLENVGKSSGVFNPEKLIWLNHHYIKESSVESVAKHALPHFKELGIDAEHDPRLLQIVKTVKEKSRTFKETAESAAFYFATEIKYDEKAATKFLTKASLEPIEALIEALKPLASFDEPSVEAAFKGVIEAKGIKLVALAQPVRVAVTGNTVSPGIHETLSALGKERTLERLTKAAEHIRKQG
ncbi:MAG: glutamate--tRNA ligase [Deltaproteobacteria bacterium]|nr:glutamate--tRNA ligase [Deltaproteobacteria bacterium]